MGKNLAQRMSEAKRAFADAGYDTGFQKGADLFAIAAHLEFGLGPERIRRLAMRVHELDDTYGIAWQNKDESDWARAQIDAALKELYGGDFHPWPVRYPWVNEARRR